MQPDVATISSNQEIALKRKEFPFNVALFSQLSCRDGEELEKMISAYACYEREKIENEETLLFGSNKWKG